MYELNLNEVQAVSGGMFESLSMVGGIVGTGISTCLLYAVLIGQPIPGSGFVILFAPPMFSAMGTLLELTLIG